MQKAAFRLPPLGYRLETVARPPPTPTPIERVTQCADFSLFGGSVEIASSGQDTCHQQCGVDQGQLAVPYAPTAAHVQEMIVKPLEACRIGLIALGALPKKLQRLQRERRRLGAPHPAALNRNGIARQGEPDDRDAARGPCSRSVCNQPVLRIGIVRKITEGGPLQPSEQRIV